MIDFQNELTSPRPGNLRLSNDGGVPVVVDGDGRRLSLRATPGAPVNAAKAGTTLDFTGQPSAGGTVTVGGKTYTAYEEIGTVANRFLIGETADDTYANLVAAVTAGDGAGTLYGSLTEANEVVTATLDTGLVSFEALSYGPNEMACSETLTNASLRYATLVGGQWATEGCAGDLRFESGTLAWCVKDVGLQSSLTDAWEYYTPAT